MMVPYLPPTVSLGGTSAVVSDCGHDRGPIEHRVAQALTGHWVAPEGPADRPPHCHLRMRSPLPPAGSILAGVRGCPRGVVPITPHPARRDTPGVADGMSHAIIAPAFLGMRCPE